MIQLFNVIEIDPFRYSKEKYEIPELSDLSNSEDLHERWQKAIATLNLNLDSIKIGSYFVDIENVDDENLKIILKVVFEDSEIEGTDFLALFNGGLILMENNEILIEPTCCSDLENLRDWQYIFENNSSGWSQLWIGHPWVFYKKENGMIQFSNYSDLNLNEFLDIKPIFEIDESNLRIEFEKVNQQQIKFKIKISEILKKMKIDDSERISELMTGVK
ncbi:hypothetical protein [Chryseobacterium sp. SIMBA_029]|uniref:hypothetical protein n=1 Tax=Chryseobacterium sp. SIMBA_029 TaxID=3085772 RepID=UPI00397CA7DC